MGEGPCISPLIVLMNTSDNWNTKFQSEYRHGWLPCGEMKKTYIKLG